MKKHNDINNGGALELDGLLRKLKERHDAREQSGIYASEDEFRRRFFQAAHAQERPHFPMIWKAAAGIAVCLLAFQLVLTTLKDDSSAMRADNYGVPAAGMVDGYGYAAPETVAAAPTDSGEAAPAMLETMAVAMNDAEDDDLFPSETTTMPDDEAPMLMMMSAESFEGGESDEMMADTVGGFSAQMLRAALAAANDADDAAPVEVASADEMPAAASAGFAARSAGGAPAGGFGKIIL